MGSRRDRHGRGVRGPMSLPNRYTRRASPIKGRTSPAEFFLQVMDESVRHLMTTCPEVITAIDIGVEDVPTGAMSWDLVDRVPLAAAMESSTTRPARIVLFRRPLERRASSRAELRELVHYTLVEQLSGLTGRSMPDLDPDIDDQW